MSAFMACSWFRHDCDVVDELFQFIVSEASNCYAGQLCAYNLISFSLLNFST